MFDKIFGNEHSDSTAYMKMLESRLKLSIETGAEASALNALQFPRPRLFHQGRPIIHMERNKSRLNKLPDHKSWKSGGAGIHNHIVKQMNLIHSSMQSDINHAFGGDSRTSQAMMISTMSLTATVTFITQLLKAVDNIYEKLHVMSKFTAEQGWCLTMQILDRIMEDLYAPKDGVLDAMTISDPLSVCSHLVWASFKTHDIMTSYVDKHFENHPAISTEYVKFLATNSGFEKVEKLSGLVDTLTEKLTKTMEDAKKAASKADNASMKLTDALREVAALTKRVKSLEDKR